MPAAVAVPLLQFGVPAAIGATGTVVASKIGSNANKTASRYEYDATMKALEDAKAERDYTRAKDDEQRTYERGELADKKTYDRGQYADYLGRLSPYETAGATAVNRFAARSAAPLPAVTNGPAGGGMVQMKAPNGQVKAIPAHLVAKAEAKGAVRL